MFNRFKEKLSGFKESLATKIKEKTSNENAANKAPSVENKTALREEIQLRPSNAEAKPGKSAANAQPTQEVKPNRVSFAERTKSLIFEQEVVLDEKDLTDPLWELEMALLESDVALPVAEEVVNTVKTELVGKKKKIGSDTAEIAESVLSSALMKVLSKNSFDFDEFVENKEKPVKIIFVGVNGTGKTTSIAKVALYLKEHGYSVVMAAGDTFRAGAIEQLETHANRLDIKIVKHKTGGDPAAVIFDAIEYAKAHNKDVVLADTAGRLHTNVNLMDQMKKIVRVTEPDMLIFVDEAIAGNDAVERARLFNEAVPIDGSILTKTDADAKGGSAISIAYITGKPVLFLGVGQDYPDLVKFDPQWLIDRLMGVGEAAA